MDATTAATAVITMPVSGPRSELAEAAALGSIMRVYEHSDPDALSARSHPWTDAVCDPTHRYRDFRAEPGLIRSSLEDWRPWEPHAGIETFYRMLEWLNGPSSIFEPWTVAV